MVMVKVTFVFTLRLLNSGLGWDLRMLNSGLGWDLGLNHRLLSGRLAILTSLGNHICGGESKNVDNEANAFSNPTATH